MRFWGTSFVVWSSVWFGFRSALRSTEGLNCSVWFSGPEWSRPSGFIAPGFSEKLNLMIAGGPIAKSAGTAASDDASRTRSY